jgi:hypothetical protein
MAKRLVYRWDKRRKAVDYLYVGGFYSAHLDFDPAGTRHNGSVCHRELAGGANVLTQTCEAGSSELLGTERQGAPNCAGVHQNVVRRAAFRSSARFDGLVSDGSDPRASWCVSSRHHTRSMLG